MPEPIRRTMERGFDADLSAVRFHTGRDVDAMNDQMNARAFTVGNDVFFRGGVPDAESSDGRRLIAHELAHTFQQGAVRRSPVVRRWGGSKSITNTGTSLHDYIDAKGEELMKFLSKQFGASGMSFRRSDEARAWRQGLKDQARVQASADVDTALDNYDPDGEGNRQLLDTEKAHYRISAKQKVYSTSKQSVNTAVEAAVEKVQAELWGNRSMEIFQAAVRAHTDHLQRRPGDTKGGHKAAQSLVDDRLKAAMAEGRSAKRVAFGKEAGAPSQSSGVTNSVAEMDQGKLEREARAQVTTDKVGEKAVKKTIEADSVGAGMGVFGTFLDNVVGSSGDQVSLAVEFRIPLEGFYIQFTLTGKAARGIDGAMTAGVPQFGNPRRLEVMFELAFRIGTGIPDVLDIGADFKAFLRGGADDTELCMKAFSYGAYRRIAAVSDTAADWWAAGSDKGTSEKAVARAEAWAAMIEQQVFELGGGYVDVGAGFGIGAELTLGGDDLFGGGKIGGGVSGFHRYDQGALEKSLGKRDEGGKFASVVDGADEQSRAAAAKNRRRQAKGTYGASYNVGLEASFRIPRGPGVGVAASLSGSINNPSSFGIEITGTMEYAGGSTSAIEKWAAGYATAAADILKKAPAAVKPFFTDRQDVGTFADLAASATQVVNSDGNRITDALANAWKVAGGPADGAAGLVTTSSLQVALIIGCDGGSKDETTGKFTHRRPILRIEVRSGRKLEINTPMAGAAGVKVSAEKTSRILALGLDAGNDDKKVKVDAEILGVRTRGKSNQRGKKSRL